MSGKEEPQVLGPTSRKEEALVGIVGATLGPEARELPEDAPPLWAESATLREVGKRTPRLDGIDKVTGRARYTADVRRPGMLHAVVLRSPHAHAHIRRIDTAVAERLPGVRAIVVLPHLAGVAEEGSAPTAAGAPVAKTLYAGQPIAAVAAGTAEEAARAAAQIYVDYEVLPHVVSPEEAQKDGAPLVFSRPVSMRGSAGGGGAGGALGQRGNVRGPKRSTRRGRDVEQARKDVAAILSQAQAKGHIVLRGTYRTQVQTHSALETHGLVAEWSKGGDELSVWASTQGLYSVRDELCEVLGLGKGRVRVISDYVGGGFGAKFGAGNFGVLCALLAKKARAPVRLCLSRREEHLGVGNRPGSDQTLTLCADKNGQLLAIQLLGFGHGGAGAGAGFAGPAQNLYACPSIYTEESDVFTHSGPLCAFRAPGHPQGAFALEQAMDELAERLGLDPLVLRERNDPHPARREERRRGAEAFGWTRRRPAGKGAPEDGWVRGLGMAQGLWYHLVNLNSNAEVRLHRDGTVELLTGVQDIGGGIRTPLAQVVAEELGVPLSALHVKLGDSRLPPGPASGGSVTTASITPAARDAAHSARRALSRELQAALGLREADAVQLVPGGGFHIRRPGQPDQILSHKAAAARMRKDTVVGTGVRRDDHGGFQTSQSGRGVGVGQLGGVQFAEVRCDRQTGVIRVERVVAVHDCGRPINLLLAESQVKGGVIQGLSYALFEERRMDRRTGQVLNGDLMNYRIAGALDTPRIEVHFLEELRGRSSTDAGGIGEPATVPTAAAVANAVYNALGVRLRELPMTPARVLAALAAQRKPAASGGGAP